MPARSCYKALSAPVQYPRSGPGYADFCEFPVHALG